MDAQLKTNLTSPKHWVRLVYMILFAFFLYIAAMVMSVLVVVQFIFSLFTGSDNRKLRAFGHSLTTYIQQALMFLSFNSEFKPFPFADWPDLPHEPTADDAVQAADVVVVEPQDKVARDSVGDIKSKPQARSARPATPATEETRVPPESKPAEAASARRGKGDEAPVDADANSEPPLVDPEAEKKILS